MVEGICEEEEEEGTRDGKEDACEEERKNKLQERRRDGEEALGGDGEDNGREAQRKRRGRYRKVKEGNIKERY